MSPDSSAWQFHFAAWQWLLLPLVVIILMLVLRLLGVRYQWRVPLALPENNQQYYHPQYSLISRLVIDRISQTMGRFRWLNTLLVWMFIVLCSVSLARPEWIQKQTLEPREYRDIVFVVDTSVSMMQRDYLLDGQRIDRMTLLKGVLSRFIDQLRGHNLSIIVYGESAYTLVPLSSDQQLVKAMLARMHVGMAGRSAAMGNALAQAVLETEQSASRERVLVLLTDGTRNTGQINISTATELARQASLPVYTVAIGARTHKAGEQKVSGLIYDPADIEVLKSVSAATGGRFYWAGDARALSHAIEDIESAEKSLEKPSEVYVTQPLYYWPLGMALLLICLLQLMQLYRRGML